jgi:serine/threonine protein kinase
MSKSSSPQPERFTPQPDGGQADGQTDDFTKHRTSDSLRPAAGQTPSDSQAAVDSNSAVTNVPLPAATRAAAPPTRLGQYELLEKLGEGGMGAVYKARHDKLKKIVAVKVLPPERLNSVAAISRFEREMQAVGALNHPHIVQAHDAGEFNGTHFLVMEYVEGTDLSQWVKGHGPLSVRDACQAIRQAALGLQHAHEHGLVHRDIKPSNLFLTKSGQVKLLDLGLARLAGDDVPEDGLTTTGQMLGTPDYMAPEQWDDTHSVDGRADLYSLGCTLCYLLTGKPPFAADKRRTILQIMKAHAEAPIPDLTALCPQVPVGLNAIFQRLIAKDPNERFVSTAEMLAFLEPFSKPVAVPNDIRPDDDIIHEDSPQSSGNYFHASKLPAAERQRHDLPTTITLPTTHAARARRRRIIAVSAVVGCAGWLRS